MPTVRISLRFGGEIDPATITDRLGVQPKHAGRAGEPIIPDYPRLREEDGWATVLVEDDQPGSEIGALLAEAMSVVEQTRPDLEALTRDGKISGSLYVAVEVPPDEYVPGIDLLPDWSRLLADAGLHFEIDGMLLGNEDDSEG